MVMMLFHSSLVQVLKLDLGISRIFLVQYPRNTMSPRQNHQNWYVYWLLEFLTIISMQDSILVVSISCDEKVIGFQVSHMNKLSCYLCYILLLLFITNLYYTSHSILSLSHKVITYKSKVVGLSVIYFLNMVTLLLLFYK